MAHPIARLDVAALPLSRLIRQKLQDAGFRTTADLEGVLPLDLATGTPAYSLDGRLVRPSQMLLG